MDGFGTAGALVGMEQQVVRWYSGWCYGTVGGVGWSWYGWFCGWCYGTAGGVGMDGVTVQWLVMVRAEQRVVLWYSGWRWYGWR